MCLACEMFWMVAEEPPPPVPTRRARMAAATPETDFACDTLDAGKPKPAKVAKDAKPRAIHSKKRNLRAQSERRP